MRHSDVIVIWIAGFLQISVACYALRLNRLFGTTRVGWSLFTAFLLVAIIHLVQATDLFASGSAFGIKIEVLHVLTSFLLLIGLAHIETVLKERDRIKHQAQKMQAIGQLAEGIAHDFNNILTVIQGYTSLLAARQCDSETTDQLKQISLAVDRSAGLTRQLLAFGRHHSMQVESLDLCLVVQNLAKMLRRLIGEDITVRSTYDHELPTIIGNVGMIEQVIINLVVNARDAMPNGGTVTISLFSHEVDQAHVMKHPGAKTGEFVCIRVSDTGCGIQPGVIGHIFEPFFTTKADGKGTGLGLATVCGIVKQHSGWVEVNSKVGKGTEFTAYFPRASQPATKTEPTKPVTATANSGPGIILLVEDEEPVRTLTGQILKQNGYEVLEANCGSTALKIWKEKSSEIDLLLTDSVMPGGMSGHDLAEKLLKTKPGLKVICTSGYDTVRQGENAGPRARFTFLSKPYAPEHLLKAIRDSMSISPESKPVSVVTQIQPH